MANTIGKDKRTNSARTAAASRLKTTGAGAAKPLAPKAPAPVERDVAVAEADEEIEALDMADDDDMAMTEQEDDDATSDLAISRSNAGSVARRAHAAPARGGFIGFVIRLLLMIPGARYVASSAQELRKVTAPTPREAWNMTLLVIAMSAALALLLGAADLALIQGLQWIVQLSK